MGTDEGQLTVQDVMTRSVVTARPGTTFQEILGLMAEHAISGVPVIDEGGRLAGIVTEADLLRDGIADRGRTRALDWLLHPGKGEKAHARGHSAGDIMTSPVVTVRPTTSIREAIHTLTHAGVKRMPVVDADGRVVGIVSRVDLLRSFIRSDEQIAADVAAILDRILATDLRAVEVEVKDGRVSMTGSLDHAAQRDVIVDGVRRLPGVLEVVHTFELEDEGSEIPFAPIQTPGEDNAPHVDI
jgi:CBS domain-containing protein